MANRDPGQCAKAVQGFWNNERELIKQGQGTRDWSVQEQIEIMNFKPSGGERKNAAAPTYGQEQATEYGMSYDKYEGQHMKSAEAHPDFQGDPDNIQALTRNEHQQAHGGDFRNPTNGYYDPQTGQIMDFGDNPPANLQPQQLSEAYADTAEYQYIINSTDEKQTQNIINNQEDNYENVLDGFEQNKAEMQNPTQDNFEDVLNNFDQKKAEMQNITPEQDSNTGQDMSGNGMDSGSGGMDM